MRKMQMEVELSYVVAKHGSDSTVDERVDSGVEHKRAFHGTRYHCFSLSCCWRLC